jgi:hypothetical protein
MEPTSSVGEPRPDSLRSTRTIQSSESLLRAYTCTNRSDLQGHAIVVPYRTTREPGLLSQRQHILVRFALISEQKYQRFARMSTLNFPGSR